MLGDRPANRLGSRSASVTLRPDADFGDNTVTPAENVPHEIRSCGDQLVVSEWQELDVFVVARVHRVRARRRTHPIVLHEFHPLDVNRTKDRATPALTPRTDTLGDAARVWVNCFLIRDLCAPFRRHRGFGHRPRGRQLKWRILHRTESLCDAYRSVRKLTCRTGHVDIASWNR